MPRKPKPLVAILMGSDSDLPVMAECARVLESYAIPYELEVLSAHRDDPVRGPHVVAPQAPGAMRTEIDPDLAHDLDGLGRRRRAVDVQRAGRADLEIGVRRGTRALAEIGLGHRAATDVSAADEQDSQIGRAHV